MNKNVLIVLVVLAASQIPFKLLAQNDIHQNAAADSNASAEKPRLGEEIFGYDLINGVTNQIARIAKVTPVDVQVFYTNSKGGRKIPRQDLPPELAAKFPYDEAKAAQYRKQQIEIAAQQAAARAAAARQVVLQREWEITNEIASLRARDIEIQKQKNILRDLGPGNGRRVKLANLNNEQESIRERVSQLNMQLVQVQAQRDRMP